VSKLYPVIFYNRGALYLKGNGMKQEDILFTIFRVIMKRMKRGATEKNINAYKKHLCKDVWRNTPELCKEIKNL